MYPSFILFYSIDFLEKMHNVLYDKLSSTLFLHELPDVAEENLRLVNQIVLLVEIQVWCQPRVKCCIASFFLLQ